MKPHANAATLSDRDKDLFMLPAYRETTPDFLTTSVIDWRSDIGSLPDTDGDFSIAQIAFENTLNGNVTSNSNRPDHVKPKGVVYKISTAMIVS